MQLCPNCEKELEIVELQSRLVAYEIVGIDYDGLPDYGSRLDEEEETTGSPYFSCRHCWTPSWTWEEAKKLLQEILKSP